MLNSRVLWLVLLYTLAGCADSSVHPQDKNSLGALKPLNPKYKLDDLGRVIVLRMDSDRVDDMALKHVASFTELKVLSLNGSSITDNGLVQLKELGQLRSLGVGNTKLSDDGLATIGKMPKLQRLWISENENMTNEAIAEFTTTHPKVEVHR
jgi:Leucine-rich repeat (LRR) protein